MSKRVLIIDDDEAIRDSFSMTLKIGGYIPDAADSGMKGIERIKADVYDMILLDLKMPGMDGVETLKEIRKINDTVPIYIVTAFHEEFFKRLKPLAKANIAFELMKKPIDGDQLLMIVESVTEGAGNRPRMASDKQGKRDK